MEAQKRSRKEIRCLSSYCEDLFAPTVSAIQSPVQLVLGGKPLESPAIVSYRIYNCGNVPCTEVKVLVKVSEPDAIVNWSIHSESELLKQRIACEREGKEEILLKIPYLNEREWFDIMILESPCLSAERTTLEVQAEGCHVHCSPMQADCSLRERILL
jgi:hypothetical protein